MLSGHCMSVKTVGRCNDTDIRDIRDKKNNNTLFNPCRQLSSASVPHTNKKILR